MPLMEYEEPAESLVTAETCVAAVDVAADKSHDNTSSSNEALTGLRRMMNHIVTASI